MDWYEEAKARRELDPSYGYGKIAKEYGLTYDTVRNKFRRDPNNKEEKVAEKEEESLDKRIYKLLNTGKQFDKEYLCNKFNIPQKILSATLECLKDEGIQLEETGQSVLIRKMVIPRSNTHCLDWDGDKVIRFGLIGDTHLGSKWEQLDFLQKLYKTFASEGVDKVYHAGDLTDGFYKNRPGHIYELNADCIGASYQANHVINNYPDDCATYYILGNHDETHVMNGGTHVGEIISSRRKDLIYLGYNQATINLTPKCKMELVHPKDGSCFDDKTEILTIDGWKLFKDLSKQNKVATMTKTEHKFEWQNPTEITNMPYSGDMLHFKSRTVDMLVTPNHGMWTRDNPIISNRKDNLIMPQKSHRRKSFDWHMEKAEDISKTFRRQKWQLTNCCESWVGEMCEEFIEVPYIESKNKGMKNRMKHIGKIQLKDFCELVAWYVTEGCCTKKNVNISQYKNYNPDNHAQIISLFQRIGFEPYVTDKGINLNSIELSSFLVNTCGKGSREVFIPPYLKNLPTEYLKIMFEVFIKADGWINGVSYAYRSISKQLLNDVAEIAVKLGYSVHFNKDTLGISTMQKYPTINKLPEIIPYNGNIYCCRVPNELIFVRRNGKCTWSHNSYAISYSVQRYLDSISGGDKCNISVIGHYHKAFYMFYRNVHAFLPGCLQAQTPFQKGKKLSAHIGGFIVEIHVDKEGTITRCKSEFIPCYKPFLPEF